VFKVVSSMARVMFITGDEGGNARGHAVEQRVLASFRQYLGG
jgi:hypothetical protein